MTSRNKRIILRFFRLIEMLLRQYFLSITLREKSTTQLLAFPDVQFFEHKIAIVMQGPIITKGQFTLETLKLYRRRYPSIIIILSTWDSYPKELTDLFLKENIQVVKNEIPENRGVSNINLQIKSTREVLKEAKNFGAE